MAKDAIVALVGGETLLGADMREMIADRLPQARTRLIGARALRGGEGGGKPVAASAILTAEGGEAAVITGLDGENLSSAQAIVLAGPPESSRQAMAMLRGAGVSTPPPIFDLTGGLEDLPEARLAPEPARIQIVPHPAAAVLVALLRTIHEKHAVERAVAQVMAPASEAGRAGVEELEQQTTQLFRFQPLEKSVFGGEQLAFNLLAGTLGAAESRVEKHLASLLSRTPDVPMPSLRMVQAPVMHGYSFSIWLRFTGSRDGVRETLAAGGFDVWPDDPPNAVGVAGQSGMSVGAIEADRQDHQGLWLWLVADQFRVAAGQCVSLLGAVL